MRIIAVVAVVLSFVGASHAGVMEVTCHNDSAVGNARANWDGVEDITITGSQLRTGGHFYGEIATTTASDPSLTLTSSVVNATGFNWSSYAVNVSMDRQFTLSDVAAVQAPTSWIGTVTQDPVLIDGVYTASLLFAGNPADVVADSQTFAFKYKLTFEGSTRYSFWQEMNPIPEPTTIGLMVLGAVGMVLRRRRRTA